MKELQPTKGFYLVEGAKMVESKDSCEGCVFDCAKDMNVPYTCSYSYYAKPILTKIAKDGVEKVEQEKRIPDCNRQESPFRKPFIYVGDPVKWRNTYMGD